MKFWMSVAMVNDR